jgi:hypothetical protein
LATQGDRALVSTVASELFCAQTKEGKKCHGLAKYCLVLGEDFEGCVRVNEACLKHKVRVEPQSAVP